MLIVNKTSVCHNVFKGRLLQRRQKAYVCEEVLIYDCFVYLMCYEYLPFPKYKIYIKEMFEATDQVIRNCI